MTVRERDRIRRKHGLNQGEFAERVGMVGPESSSSTAVRSTPRRSRRWQGTGTSVVHCPTGPAKMGSGVTPVHELHSAGINLSLGTTRPPPTTALT